MIYNAFADGTMLYNPDAEGYHLITGETETEIGKAGCFKFSIAPGHARFNDLTPMKTKVSVTCAGTEMFFGRVLYADRTMYGVKSVYCEGALSFLVDSIQRPYKFDGYPADLLAQYIQKHNEQVEEDKRFTIGTTSAFPEIDPERIPVPYPIHYTTVYTANRNTTMHAGNSASTPVIKSVPSGSVLDVRTRSGAWYFCALDGIIGYVPQDAVTVTTTQSGGGCASNPYFIHVQEDGYESTMDQVKKYLVDEFGGYLRVRRENGVLYLDYLKEFTSLIPQAIEFSRNLLDLTEHITAEDLFTVMIPLGKESNGSRMTVASVNQGKDYIESSTGISAFGRIVKTVIFEDAADEAELLRLAQEELQNAVIQALTINVKAVDLNMMGIDTIPIRDGVNVRVISRPHGIDTTMLCTKVKCNILQPDKTVYTIGRTYDTLTDVQTLQGTSIRSSMTSIASVTSRVAKVEENQAEGS